MLGEAKQRNETLSQAYAELHAEYVKLKAAAATTAVYAALDPTVGARQQRQNRHGPVCVPGRHGQLRLAVKRSPVFCTPPLAWLDHVYVSLRRGGPHQTITTPPPPPLSI